MMESAGIPYLLPSYDRIGSPFITLDMVISLTLDNGRNDGAVIWYTCLPRRLERTEEVLEDGGVCFFADLKPKGGLYGWLGPGM